MFHDVEFWEAFLSIRCAFVTGRLGSGKTLLCFALGREAIKNRYVLGIFANIPHVFPRTSTVANAVVIVDEAWQILDNRYSADNFSYYGAWGRKSNTLWAFPSVYGIDKRVRALQVERVFDLAILPVRIWIYCWKSADGRGGWFGLSYPERYFGTYPTKAAPLNDGGAVDSLLSLVPEAIELVQRGRGRGGVWKEESGKVGSGLYRRVDKLEHRMVELERRVSLLAAGGVGEDKNAWG